MNDLDPDLTIPPAPLATPSANEVRLLMRAQNTKLAMGAIVVIALLVVTVWFSASGRAASRDSFNSTSIALANAPRSACITERRNAELDAIGDANAALGLALIAGLVTDDSAEALSQVSAFREAEQRRQRVSESMAPDVLDLPPSEGGCGPPILSLDDLPKDTE